MKEMVHIELSRKQAEMVSAACEEYLRLRIHQFCGIADDLAENAYPNKEDFDRRIFARDDLRDAFDAALSKLPRCTDIPDDALIAETVWLGIRSALAWHDNPEGNPWDVRFDPPFTRCDEKIPDVKIITNQMKSF